MPKLIIDDLKPDEVTKGYGGLSILFENPNIRKMLTLADAVEDDIFCDLGCGLARNLIIAATEFHVRKAIGYERNEKRFRRAANRIKFKGLADRCEVLPERLEKALDGKSKFKLEDATIVFYGLGTDAKLLHSLQKRLRIGCKLVYYYLCLFPEIMPNEMEFPFYVSRFPFTKTTSELDWLQKVVGKEESTMQRGEEPDVIELWDELSHDYKVSSNDPLSSINDYKKRMRRVLA